MVSLFKRTNFLVIGFLMTSVKTSLETLFQMFKITSRSNNASLKEKLGYKNKKLFIKNFKTLQWMISCAFTFEYYYNDLRMFYFRHKTMWGWGGDKTEVVNGFECKVFTATGVEVLTKTRVEHLNAEDKQTAQSKL